MSLNRPPKFDDSFDEPPFKDEPLDLLAGKLVGSFRLVHKLGKGGMGAVYLAERADGEFRQQVAVKLIKRGMDTEFVLNRFRHERQILASLDHPFIARLLNGGTTDDGLPYFVMDYIKGEPLVEYAETRRLDLRERLLLFRQICEAVEYAHQKQIVHRDLKPSNILVTASGAPKLLDFGIAKMLDPEAASETLLPTATQMRLMTAEYASPEQARGQTVTRASDVYSLGVVLYELLTGKRPYRFTSRAPHEVAQVVCEQEPILPSEAAGEVGEKAKQENAETQRRRDKEENSASKSISMSSLLPVSLSQLRGNLDNIILKALRKSPAERYESVEALSDDIGRHLEGQRAEAPPYVPVLQKSSAPAAAANLAPDKNSIAVLPLKFLGGATSEDTGDAYLGVGLADALITRLSQLNRFVVRPTSSVLRYSQDLFDPFAAGKELGVRYILDGNIRRAGARLRVSLQLFDVFHSKTVWAHQFNEEAKDALDLEDAISAKVAESLIPRLTGADRRRLEKRGTNVAAAYEAYLRGRYFYNKFTDEALLKAVESYREAIRLDPEYALPHVGIADFFNWSAIFGEMPSREAFPQAAVAARRALEIDDTLAEAYAVLAFSTFLFDLDRGESLRLVKKALELNPNSSFAHECLSNLLASEGRFDEAAAEIRRAEELDPLAPRAVLMTAWVLYQTRHFDEAVTKARKANEMEKDFPQGLLHLGNNLTAIGETDEAVAVLEKSYRLWNGSGLPGYMLCHALVAAGRREDARKILDELHESAAVRRVKPYFLAMCHAALGERDAAFQWFEKALKEKNEWMIWLGTESKLDSLRDDPRFADLLRRTNNPAAAQFVAATRTEPNAAPREKSIAVLPLKIFGTPTGSNDDEYLGVGLADALVTRLSNVRRLVVRPTSSVLPFGGADADPFRAGAQLGVDYVLDGSVRRAGERIRVTVRLLSIAEHSSRWAENFNERFTDVLELEDVISEKVTESLVPQLTGEERRQLSKRGTSNAEAYEAYMRGRYFWNQFTPETFPKALEAFEKAVALDPGYALAHVGIADFYNWATIFGMLTSREGYGKTKAAALRALELDDGLSEAHAVLGFLTAFADFEWAEAERLFTHALRLNPNNGLAHEWYSAMLGGVGRIEEGVREIVRAHELDPLSLRAKTLAAWHLYQFRRFPEALARADELIEMNPHYYQGFFQRGNALNEMGRAGEAVADLQKALRLAPDLGYMYYKLCFALVALDRREEAREVLLNFEKIAASGIGNAYHFGMCYAALDERDRAFEWFNKAVDDRDLWLTWLATEPKLDKLRGDERFNDLLRRTNRPQLVKNTAGKTRAKDKPKIFAALPFKFHSVVTGEADEDKFLAVGLTDALITRLSKIRSLVVRPTSSVMNFADEEDAFRAGRELEADFVLDGNVRRAGERIRVTAQLLRVADRSTAWSETFDERFTDVLELEDSISEKVAGSLLPQLAGEEQRRVSKRGTNSPAAYEAYLRGRYFWNQFAPELLPKTLEAYEEAVRLDPDYALAHVGIADYYNWAIIFGARPGTEFAPRAKRAARRALEIDPDLGEAYAALAFTTVIYDWNLTEAERLYRLGIEHSPNYSLVHDWYSNMLTGMGRAEEGLREIRRAEELEPLSLRAMSLTAFTLYQTRRYEEAIAKARQIIEFAPGFGQGYFQLGNSLVEIGRADEAVAPLQKACELMPGVGFSLYGLCFALVGAGREAEAREVLDEMLAAARAAYFKPYFIALACAAVGERERAFEWLEKAFAEGGGWLIWLGTEPKLAALHDDPRFARLLEKTNNPLAEKFKAKARATDAPKTIAVLPFKYQSLVTGETGDDQFLSVGLTDALITRLSKIRSIVVRPTSSVLRFADETDAFRTGKELEAEYVLEGSIRRAGERIRITAKLLSISDRTTRWAETFDEKSTDVLELEDSISEKVANSLVPQLTGEEQRQLSKRETDSSEAYEAYLRGRFNWSLQSEEGFNRAIRFYRRAVKLDPDYAQAYAAIAEYYIFLGIHCVIPFAEGAQAAQEAARRAVRLEPTLAEGYAALGFTAVSHELDWRKAEDIFKRAIELNPNSITANLWYVAVLLQSADFEGALRQIGRIHELDPGSLLGMHMEAWTFYHARRFEESIAAHRRTLEAEPNYAWGRQTFSWVLRHVGRHGEAVAQAEKAVQLTGENPFYLASLAATYAVAGEREKAATLLARLGEMSKTRFVSEYMLALAYCALGDEDRAFKNLEKTLAARDGWINWLGVDPQFDRLRGDARYEDLLRRAGNPLAKPEKVETRQPKHG